MRTWRLANVSWGVPCQWLTEGLRGMHADAGHGRVGVVSSHSVCEIYSRNSTRCFLCTSLGLQINLTNKTITRNQTWYRWRNEASASKMMERSYVCQASHAMWTRQPSKVLLTAVCEYMTRRLLLLLGFLFPLDALCHKGAEGQTTFLTVRSLRYSSGFCHTSCFLYCWLLIFISVLIWL